MLEENKALVRKFFEITDSGRTPTELLAPGFTAHIPGSPPMDAAGFQQFQDMMRSALSNFNHPIDDLVAEGDKVAFRLRIQGTHTGELMGAPASGNQVSVAGIGIMRIAGGKVAEFRGNPDVMGLMQQIGAIPTPS